MEQVATALKLPAKAQQTPAKRKPGPRRSEDVVKIGRITPLVRAACAALIDGQAKTITEAAQLVGCRREHLSIMLRKPHVDAYLARETKRHACGAVTATRAANVFTSLLGADSEKVRADVADRILTAAGALPSEKHGTKVGVNVNVITPGYIVDWRPDAPQALEAQADVIE